MPVPMKIDFVSDISCPWCIVGLGGLDEALARVGDLVDAEIIFQPFELNPSMPPEGQNIVAHVAEKYGSTQEQSSKNRDMIHQSAAEVGFTMKTGETSRIYNTFDAHRLLHWARGEGQQMALKRALFSAYFTEGQSPGDHQVLADVAASIGLDRDTAMDVLTSGRYAEEVRHEQAVWRQRGITSVPAVIINDKYLISGGQPADAFEQALLTVAAEASKAA